MVLKMLETADYPITLTQSALEKVIVEEKYYTPPGTLATICVMKLQNGTIITGESHCLCPTMYTPQKGEVMARERALHKVHELENYLLLQKIYDADRCKL